MGHNISFRTYPEHVNKKAVQAEWDEYVSHVTWQEGGHGLDKSIHWIDHVCNNYEEAEKYINDHDSGWYDQLAVKYREYPEMAPTKALMALRKRLETEAAKETAYYEAHSIAAFKAEYVGCPNCGSKLKKDLMKKNSCPLCGTDLRSKTTLDTLKRYAENKKALTKQIAAEERKMEQKAVKQSTIRWLVKVEYHT